MPTGFIAGVLNKNNNNNDNNN